MKGFVNLVLMLYLIVQLGVTVLRDVFKVISPHVILVLCGLAVAVAVVAITSVIVWTVLSLSGAMF